MFKKLPTTDFEKNQIMGFRKWFTEFKNRFNSIKVWTVFGIKMDADRCENKIIHLIHVRWSIG